MKFLILSALLCIAFSVMTAAVPVESETPAGVELQESVPAEQVEFVEDAAVEQEGEVPEGEAQADLAEVPQERSVYCPPGWFRYQSRCFMFVNSLMSWHNAEEHCNSLQASLASVHSRPEYRFLQQIATTAGHSTAWLGGFNLQSRWMWVDRSGFYFTNWYSQSAVSSHPCLFLRSTVGWSNSNCGTSLRFICARNPNNCY